MFGPSLFTGPRKAVCESKNSWPAKQDATADPRLANRVCGYASGARARRRKLCHHATPAPGRIVCTTRRPAQRLPTRWHHSLYMGLGRDQTKMRELCNLLHPVKGTATPQQPAAPPQQPLFSVSTFPSAVHEAVLRGGGGGCWPIPSLWILFVRPRHR